jgi:hypothetical protein
MQCAQLMNDRAPAGDHVLLWNGPTKVEADAETYKKRHVPAIRVMGGFTSEKL